MPEDEPRIGLFWGLPDAGDWRFIGMSKLLSQVDAVGGFRTHPCGHLHVWPHITRERPGLRGLSYETLPRGRVNWIEEGDQFLLLLDLRLRTPTFIAKVMYRWRLPYDRTAVMNDSHYRATGLESIM